MEGAPGEAAVDPVRIPAQAEQAAAQEAAQEAAQAARACLHPRNRRQELVQARLSSLGAWLVLLAARLERLASLARASDTLGSKNSCDHMSCSFWCL